ncbi:Transcription initiation factor TFIIE subunit alpha [Coniochaeta hoffmannii]|uniref:Transcription initiation factor TFIIE subunit alpha n=1 Tax=Coniochaeta hoffmannii TaxID=91930 RepID=A0AA38R6C3_9PEZI|nr:Transcription initiation factor TFIIE subunit alpha [Coniochaeta hoffmannii]
MSAKSSPSPRQGPVDESSLPQGHCRYILLLPEVKGQRSCFHNKEAEPSEMDLLKQRIKELEERWSSRDTTVRDREDDANQAMLARVSGLEEELERSREEFSQEIKRAFANSSLAWNSFQHVQRKVEGQELRLNHVMNHLAGVDVSLQRLDDRQLELQDADTYLEERIEHIQETLDENEKPYTRGRDPRPRHRSSSPARAPDCHDRPLVASPGPGPSPANPGHSGASTLGRLAPASQLTRTGSVSAASGIWTVHISLLPHATIPMPFERNTNAYQRCLSRGLHQVVAIRGPSAEAFCAAVDKAFGSLIKGRPWMPLQAELCNAEQLQGLPMLRQLEPHLVDARYDAEFLRENCAVCDANGMMESLYITMREPHALSWHAVRRAPVFTEGLEESWEFDPLLDNDPYDDDDVAVDDDTRPAAGDIVPTFPSLKRTASEMQRSRSFGSATATAPAGEGRAKRTCPLPRKANTLGVLSRPGVGTA